jgi:hypothetical protein
VYISKVIRLSGEEPPPLATLKLFAATAAATVEPFAEAAAAAVELSVVSLSTLSPFRHQSRRSKTSEQPLQDN